VEAIGPHLSEIKRQGVRVVTNGGGMNPKGTIVMWMRIRDVYPGSEFFPSRIQIYSIPDPGSKFFPTGSRIHIKEFKYFNPKKMVSEHSEIWSGLLIPDPDPGSWSWLYTHPGSRAQKGTGRNTAVTDPDQQWLGNGTIKLPKFYWNDDL
jgi:hypothetical protein